MKIQVRSLAIALAIAIPIAVAATAKSSAAPINGTSIKAAVPAVTTDVRYRVRQGHPYASYWGYPTYNSYNSYWGYPTYNSYRGYPTYNSYRGYPTDSYSYPSYGTYAYGWW
jgi:hypothetical protein